MQRTRKRTRKRTRNRWEQTAAEKAKTTTRQLLQFSLKIRYSSLHDTKPLTLRYESAGAAQDSGADKLR